MLYLAFAGQAAVWAGLYFLLDKLSKRWEGKAFFTLMQTNALWKGMVACFVLIFPLLLLGFLWDGPILESTTGSGLPFTAAHFWSYPAAGGGSACWEWD